MCSFDRVWICNYHVGEPIRIMEVEVRGWKLKNGRGAGKDEVT